MRRVIQLVLAAAVLLLAVQGLRHLLASEETKIRWRLESMMQGFNDTRLSPALSGIGADWRHHERRVDRVRLADGLRYLFFQEKDPETHRFPFRVELEPSTLAIELDSTESTRADVAFEARFWALAAGEWHTTWHLRVRTEMRKHENLGWQMQESEHETIESDGRLMR